MIVVGIGILMSDDVVKFIDVRLIGVVVFVQFGVDEGVEFFFGCEECSVFFGFEFGISFEIFVYFYVIVS